MFCRTCGAQLKDGDKFCMECGSPQEASVTNGETNQMPKTVAAQTAPVSAQPASPYQAAAPTAQGYTVPSSQPSASMPGGAPAYAPAPASGLSLGMIYGKVFAALGSKPVMLWGLSVLCSILAALAVVLGGMVPLIGLGAALILSAGMSVVYLDGYRRLPVNSEQLFEGFKNIGRVAGGMAWMVLWVLLWSLIPFVGPFLAIWKIISYSFTPYILMRNPNVTPLQALKLSMQQTKGHCGTIFLAYFVALCVIFVAFLLIFSLYSVAINMYNSALIVFASIILFALLAVYYLAAPLFFGLVSAAFYSEIVIEGGAPQELIPTTPVPASIPLQ